LRLTALFHALLSTAFLCWTLVVCPILKVLNRKTYEKLFYKLAQLNDNEKYSGFESKRRRVVLSEKIIFRSA